MIIRKAQQKDVGAIARIYEKIHTEEEQGRTVIGWIRGVYPVQATAQAALDRDDLFVAEDDGEIVGAAVINQQQMDSYADGRWTCCPPAEEVMVLHTLVIDPDRSGKGYGKGFVAFYESYALDNGCRYLRMDTNSRNANARALYKKLGYKETDIVPCTFNGIEGVGLVLLEKIL